MARRQFGAVLALVILAALLLISFGVMVTTLNQPLAPLPTELKLADVIITPVIQSTVQPSPAPTLVASTGFVHLPPLRLALTPSPSVPVTGPTDPASTPNPTPSTNSYPFSLGQSANGRDIVGYAFPITNSPRGLVLVCGIHGDETNAWPVLESIMIDLNNKTLAQPADLSIYFVQSLNPDGTANDTRLNADRVDLNRNWDTYDWKMGVEESISDYLPRGGGPAPFSEPETQAMRDFLLELKATHPAGLTVIYFHAAVPPKGFVSPGTHLVNGQDVADTPSRILGQSFADLTNYLYANQWVGGYTVTGDASTWAVAQGFVSLTIEVPVRDELDSAMSANLKTGILQIITDSSTTTANQ